MKSTETRCPGCDAPRAVEFLSARDYRWMTDGTVFRYDRCDQCGLVFLVDPPKDLARYYDTGYHAIPETAALRQQLLSRHRYKIETVSRFLERGRILEIGPSWGAFCMLAKQRGFDVTAIEMDPECCRFLESEVGVKVVNSDEPVQGLKRVDTPDCVAMWQVLEHVRDPWTLLEAIVDKLPDGGYLVVATPNPCAYQFRLFGRHWAHLDAPRHLNLIPASLLRTRLAVLGMTEVLLTYVDDGSLECNDFGWRFSMANLVPFTRLRPVVRMAARYLTRLASHRERQGQEGTSYTAVYRKQSTGAHPERTRH